MKDSKWFHYILNTFGVNYYCEKNHKLVFWAANQHIQMISEGSCDTEDWGNDDENSACHLRKKYYYQYILWKTYMQHQIHAHHFLL